MSEPLIHLAFTDDWEVRGNGSGDPRVLQFAPMRKLVQIFDRHSVRGTFYAEVMQQLAHRRLAHKFPHLGVLAAEWEEAVLEALAQGHDVQLHLHPQWLDATYAPEVGWTVSPNRSIVHYPAEQIRDMVASGRTYLESVARRVKRDYCCIAFRAGQWCIGPSKVMLPVLVEQGFPMDTSVVAGIRGDSAISPDFSSCGETFLPYYPRMDDARRVSDKKEPIVCVPTYTFFGARFAVARRDDRKARAIICCELSRSIHGSSSPPEGRRGHIDKRRTDGAFATALLRRYTIGDWHISDMSRLNYAMMCDMLRAIRKRAAQFGVPVPVVLANHTKDVRDFSDLQRFVADISNAPDIKTVTLSDIARRLRDGFYPINKN